MPSFCKNIVTVQHTELRYSLIGEHYTKESWKSMSKKRDAYTKFFYEKKQAEPA